MPKLVNVYKASRTISDVPIDDLHIVGSWEVPGDVAEGSVEGARAFYEAQARDLADALFASLPGGTIDALLVELLDRKRSIFRVLAASSGRVR